MKKALQKEVLNCFTAIMLRYDKVQKKYHGDEWEMIW